MQKKGNKYGIHRVLEPEVVLPQPVIMTCGIVGAELSKKDYRFFPMTPGELAEAARGAVEAGGRPSQRVDIFEEVTKKYAGIVNASYSLPYRKRT